MSFLKDFSFSAFLQLVFGCILRVAYMYYFGRFFTCAFVLFTFILSCSHSTIRYYENRKIYNILYEWGLYSTKSSHGNRLRLVEYNYLSGDV